MVRSRTHVRRAKVQEIYIGSGATRGRGAAARNRRPGQLAASVTATFERSTARATSSTTVSFTLHENEIIALLGRNGAGKSTLLKTLIGIAPAANGSIRLGGHELVGLSSAQIARLGIGFVPQGRGLFAGMSVEPESELGGLKRQTGNGVHWDARAHIRIFPAHSRAARQPGGLSLGRRAADGRGGARAVGRRSGAAAR